MREDDDDYEDHYNASVKEVDEADDLIVDLLEDMTMGKDKLIIPSRAIAYEVEGDWFVRVPVQLLSSTTMQDLNITVSSCFRFLNVIYFYPELWMSADKLLLGETDADWSANELLHSAMQTDIDKHKEQFNHRKPYAPFRIKLPIKCELRLANDFGKPAYVKMHQHKDSAFRTAKQYYYILSVNLKGATKSRKSVDNIDFSLANDVAVAAGPPDPFAPPPADTSMSVG
jgi:hypothetical protein